MFSMSSFLDEMLRISLIKEAQSKAELVKKLKWPAILSGGYVGGKQVEQAVKDYSIGRQVRKQYEGQGQQ